MRSLRQTAALALVAAAAACGERRAPPPRLLVPVAPAASSPATAQEAPPPDPAARSRSSIAAAGRTTCVVRSGRVLCFGDPVGAPPWEDDAEATPTPKPVPGLEGAVAVSLSEDHACALLDRGAVACWGVVDDGTRGETSPRGGYTERRTPNPEPVAGLVARQIAAGSRFTCAITQRGGVACWGMNAGGGLGDDGPGSLVPREVAGISGAVDVVARGERACARTRGGDVWCWGGASDTKPQEKRPHTIAELAGATRIAFDDRSTCGLVSDALVCEPGPLGGRSRLDDATDIAFGSGLRCVTHSGKPSKGGGEGAPYLTCEGSHPASRGGVVDAVDRPLAVAIGSSHACALERSGAVRCWGANDAGQAGGSIQRRIEHPTRVDGISDAVKVATSQLAVCAVRKSGEVWCWGSGSGGALGPSGAGAVASSRPLVRARAERVDGVTDAVAISGGSTHFCALTRRGRVVCWGRNGAVSCSTDDDPACAAPTEVSGLTDAIDVSSFRDGNCAVRKSGAVVCWGNEYELGVPGKHWTGGPPWVVDGVRDAMRVFNGYRRTCAVRRDGTAVCWGDDVTFQAGAVQKSSAKIAEIQGAHDIVAIGRGQPDHALSRSGDLRAFDWGNSFVRATAPQPSVRIAPPLPKIVLEGVVQIAQSFYDTCARRRSGEVLCWGTAARPEAAGVDDAVDIAMSEHGTRCAVERGGNVACWGENKQGECAVEPGTFVDEPREVRGL